MKMFLTFLLCYLLVFREAASNMYYRPYEFRNVPSDMDSNASSFPNIQTNLKQPQTIYISQSKAVTDSEKGHTYTNSFNGILNKIDRNEQTKSDEKINTRGENVNGRTSLVYSKPTFESYVPYGEKSLFLEPDKSGKEIIDKITPKFDLLEPVTAKMSSKVTGLMDLVMALAGSNSNNFLMKGFKQIFIDGIMKPMLLAKGGLKVLISKISIPLISLLLINIEFLITMWWMWEDCTEQNKPVNEPVNSFNYTAFRKSS